jgi:hypothetical protein
MQTAACFSDNVDIHLHICHANLYGRKRLEVRVALPGRNSERTKARIFRTARRLFAERDIASVGIIARAELAGLEPASMLEPGRPTPAMQLTGSIRQLQSLSRGHLGQAGERRAGPPPPTHFLIVRGSAIDGH